MIEIANHELKNVIINSFLIGFLLALVIAAFLF